MVPFSGHRTDKFGSGLDQKGRDSVSGLEVDDRIRIKPFIARTVKIQTLILVTKELQLFDQTHVNLRVLLQLIPQRGRPRFHCTDDQEIRHGHTSQSLRRRASRAETMEG